MPCLGTQSGAALLLLCHPFFSEHCRAERVRRAQTRSIKPYGRDQAVPLRFVLFLTMVSLAATPALGEMHSNENPAMSDRCRTLPDGGAPDANGNSTDEEAMSETLEDCQGVLK